MGGAGLALRGKAPLGLKIALIAPHRRLGIGSQPPMGGMCDGSLGAIRQMLWVSSHRLLASNPRDYLRRFQACTRTPEQRQQSHSSQRYHSHAKPQR